MAPLWQFMGERKRWSQGQCRALTDLRKTSRIADAYQNPRLVIGKPEPLKNNLSGWWSRRIDESNRLVYKVKDELLIIAECRTHYDG